MIYKGVNNAARSPEGGPAEAGVLYIDLRPGQTCHSKTAEVTHSDGQLWGDIEWAIELLYNSVKTGSQLVWRPDPLTRCGRGSQHPAEWVPGPPVEQYQENGKETLMAIRVGISVLQFCSVSNSLSHATLSIK